jgi:hypothetical protein
MQTQTPSEQPTSANRFGSGDLLGDDILKQRLDDALALVDVGPMKSAEWMDRSLPMCKWCEKGEDVDQASARILAKEVRRLQKVETRHNELMDLVESMLIKMGVYFPKSPNGKS